PRGAVPGAPVLDAGGRDVGGDHRRVRRLPAAAVAGRDLLRCRHGRRAHRLEPRPQRFRIAGQGAAIYGSQRDAHRLARPARTAGGRHRLHAAGAAGTGGRALCTAAAPGTDRDRRHRLQPHAIRTHRTTAHMTAKKTRTIDARQHSSQVVDGLKNAPARAMLRAVGFSDADFTRPQVGIASTWANLTPCNMHIGQLAEEAVAGANAAGGKGVLFNTITVSDGISMGSPGMRYSLVSREVIADSIETVVAAEGFDGFVAIGGCDKNMPGCVMAMARLDRPSVFVYGGTIRPGAERRDIVSVFEAVGAVAGGRMSEAQLLEVERTAIPGPGACGGMSTANTMASASEALGLSLPNSSAQDAVSRDKREDCRRAGAAVVELVRRGIRPSDILSREAFENAITVVIALGGSTNAVLHLMAMAYEAGVPLSLD